jgi:aminopeptidase-like protein
MFTSPKSADDIYSVSDQGLADTFKFIKEVILPSNNNNSLPLNVLLDRLR